MKCTSIVKKAINESGVKPDFIEFRDYSKEKVHIFKVFKFGFLRVNKNKLLEWKKIKNNYFSSKIVYDGNFRITLYKISKFSLSNSND